MTWDEQCGTCDKVRDGCDFCCGTTTGDGSREELTTGDVLDPITEADIVEALDGLTYADLEKE